MPTRMLWEKVCTSRTLAELTAEEERFFFRLMVKCDDHGRYQADPSILRGHLFARMLDDISAEAVRHWRDRLAEVGLLTVYEVDGEEYLAVTTWPAYQRRRDSKSKYPPPGQTTNVSESPQDAAESGSRVVKTGFPVAGSRGPVAGSRGPDAREPQAVAVATKGAAAPGRERTKGDGLANGIAASPPPHPPPKLAPGEEWIEPGHPEYSPIVGRYKRVRV